MLAQLQPFLHVMQNGLAFQQREIFPRLLRLRVKLAESVPDIHLDCHVVDFSVGLALFGLVVGLDFAFGSVDYVRLEAEDVLVVAENGTRLMLEKAEAVARVQADFAPREEADLLEAQPLPDDVDARVNATRVHLNDELRGEAFLAELEHAELVQEVGEKVLDKLGLHLGWQQLVETKLFNDHVVVLEEGQLETLIHFLCKPCFKLFRLFL